MTSIQPLAAGDDAAARTGGAVAEESSYAVATGCNCASISVPGVLLAAWIQQVTDTLGAGDAPGTPGQALAAITALETLASAATGAQARLTVAYDTLTRAQEQADGMTASRRGRTVASDIAAARREPPYRGVRHLGLAKALLEMPNTAWALSTGQISEWKGMLLAKESAALTLEQRAGMDAELANIMLTVPDKVLESQARALAYAYDPASYLTRHRRAGNERRVTIRPASDTMVYLSALLPMIPGISCYKALQDAADRALASGNHPTTFGQPARGTATEPDAAGSGETATEADEPAPRTRSQLMADELIERLTGRTTADPADIEINLLITPDALFNDTTDPLTPNTGTQTRATASAPTMNSAPGNESPGNPTQTDQAAAIQTPPQTADAPTRGHAANQPNTPGVDLFRALAERVAAATATLITEGLDPMVIPAGVAKDILLNQAATVFLRRIFGTPGHLIAMESRARAFTGNLRKLIILRDQYCRHPWCAAPIKHIDHKIPHSEGGPTSAHNAQGLCAHHNLTKAEHEHEHEHEQRDTRVA